ncbi:MAG: type I-U CRISPR-associated protein Csx17 [Actinobacteria bacterium]|nr:type I-U CRISPR-associated protein Csx17 [Actinomycetota bacterium]
MTNVHYLRGCQPEPLGSYLKALGTFRTVAEQTDPTATGQWGQDGFVLTTRLNSDELARFFIEEYKPTPVVSPWNNSSGFGKEGADGLSVIEQSNDQRLSVYRDTIEISREILDEIGISREIPDEISELKKLKETDQLKELEKRAKRILKEQKERVMAECRSRFPDEAIGWIDSAVLLLSEKNPAYPPIVGTGGNVGHFDIAHNFHQHLVTVLDLVDHNARQRASRSSSKSRDLIEDTLFQTGKGIGVKMSASQFDPGAVGGSNSAPEGRAKNIVNPWDFILTVEGAILFAGGVARRIGFSSQSVAAAPFMVSASLGGYASSSGGEKPKGEVWVPLWENAVTLPELKRLLAEGRADWKGQPARTGVDLAKAAGSLGVDRGISGFSRYVFAVRDGQNPVAVPTGRIAVHDKPVPVIAAVAELDKWLNSVRKGRKPPAGVSMLLHAVDRAMFSVSSGRNPDGIMPLLVEAAKLEAAVGRATQFRDDPTNLIFPLRDLNISTWCPSLLEHCDSRELRLALGLSSLRDIRGKRTNSVSWLRTALTPVKVDEKSARLVWQKDGRTQVPGLGVKSVEIVLAEAHARRMLDVLGGNGGARTSSERNDVSSQVGISPIFDKGRFVRLDDIAALATGSLDKSLFADYLSACLLLNWDKPPTENISGTYAWDEIFIPPFLSIIGPFFAKQPKGDGKMIYRYENERTWVETVNQVQLFPEATWPSLLARDRSDIVVAAALRRLRIAGCQPVADSRFFEKSEKGLFLGAGPWLGAVLLCPMDEFARREFLKRSCP